MFLQPGVVGQTSEAANNDGHAAWLDDGSTEVPLQLWSLSDSIVNDNSAPQLSSNLLTATLTLQHCVPAGAVKAGGSLRATSGQRTSSSGSKTPPRTRHGRPVRARRAPQVTQQISAHSIFSRISVSCSSLACCCAPADCTTACSLAVRHGPGCLTMLVMNASGLHAVLPCGASSTKWQQWQAPGGCGAQGSQGQSQGGHHCCHCRLSRPGRQPCSSSNRADRATQAQRACGRRSSRRVLTGLRGVSWAALIALPRMARRGCHVDLSLRSDCTCALLSSDQASL